MAVYDDKNGTGGFDLKLNNRRMDSFPFEEGQWPLCFCAPLKEVTFRAYC